MYKLFTIPNLSIFLGSIIAFILGMLLRISVLMKNKEKNILSFLNIISIILNGLLFATGSWIGVLFVTICLGFHEPDLE